MEYILVVSLLYDLVILDADHEGSWTRALIAVQ
jgi:hypothetical protein